MKWASKKEFVTSTPSILKLVELAILVLAMTFFLVSNKCQSFPMFVSLYVLPITVCMTFLFISYATAIMVIRDGRNPFFIPTWVNSESCLNACAGILMVVGSTLTLTYPSCSDTTLTVISVALGYICAVLFGCSGAITYLTLVKHEERDKGKTKLPQLEAKEDRHIATLAGIF